MIDDDNQVLEFEGHTAPLLAFVPGAATLDILRILRADLVGSLTDALSRAKATKRPARAPGSDVRIYGRTVRVVFRVAPVRGNPDRWKVVASWRNAKSHADDDLHGRHESPMLRIARLLQEFSRFRNESRERQTEWIAELENTFIGVRQIQEELETSNAELEATNVQLSQAIAERDAAQRRLSQSEATSREVLETASQAILTVSSKGTIIQANEMAHAMFRFDHGDLVGRRLSTLIPSGSRRVHARQVRGFLEAPRRRPMGEGRELWAVRSDGSQFPVEVGLSSIVGEDGLVAIAFVTDITERKRAERTILEDHERLRDLSKRLITAAEDETRKWARELHDVYTQRLVAIAMEIDGVVESERGPGNRTRQLRVVESKVRSLADDVHRLSRRMHPAILHDLGLVAALRSELSAFQKQQRIDTALDADPARDIPPDVALCFYRIVQEALNNIRRHARSKRVHVELRTSNTGLTMAVRDDGVGFDSGTLTERGLGLLSMEERAQSVGGSVSIESTPGRGTAVHVRVPLPEHPDR